MIKKTSIVFIILFSFILFSCPNSTGNSGSTDENDNIIVSVPKISPAAGDYSEGFKTITITAEKSEYDIFYTTDGTEPSYSSNRYTEPFTIIGSKTVKAIAAYKKHQSSVISSTYNLNAGKNSSQLGVIKGTFNLAENLSKETKSKLASTTVYISSSDLPGVVKEGKMGESFYIDGLDTSKSYEFYFSNKAPGTVIGSRAASTSQTDEIIAIKLGVTPAEGAGTDLGKVTLKQTGTITGKAFKYDESGEEESDHSGITVFIPGTSYAAYTAKDGTFAISSVPQGMYTIRAMYSGYTYSEQENILLSEDDKTTDELCTEIESEFVLYYSKGTVKGSVLLSNRSSNFAGIDIILTDSANIHSYSATTNSTGNWTINDVTPGTYNLEFHKDGYVDQKVNDITVAGARITNVARIVLKEDGGSISGKVFVNNSSIAGISVMAERDVQDTDDSDSTKIYYALSKDDGTYYFDSVAPGLYTVTAVYPGYKSISQSNVSVYIGESIILNDLNISEKTTYTVTGSCVLAGVESGFEGTSVLLQSSSDKNVKKSTTTNIEGIYTISDIDAGSYILTFSRSGFITNSSVTIDVGISSIAVVENVILQSNAGTVTGTVTLESAETFEGIDILLTREGDGKNYSTVTDSNGHFGIAGVAPGTYRVQATKNGYNTSLSDPFIVSSGITSSPAAQQLKISLRSLYGTVTLQGRTDFTGVRITATKTTNTTEIYSALSNREGFYALSGMTPGEYILSYAYEGYKSPNGEYVSLGDESSITLGAIELNRATGRISGIVKIEGSSDYSGILVTLVGTDYKYTTQADGTYSFTVPTGNYIGGVKFEKEGYQLTVKGETLIVLADRNNEVTTATMYSSTGTVTGTVTLESAAQFDDIDIIIYSYDDSATSYTSVTDSEGHFAVYGVAPGIYRIQATKKGFTVVNSDPFTISAGTTVTSPSIKLSISRRALYGTITLEGRTDYTGVRITATKTTDTTEIYSALSNKDGFYALSGMTPGEYILSFSYEGYRSYTSSSVSLNNNSSIDMEEIELVKATGKISGIVNLENCTNHSGVTVSIVGTDYTTVTEQNGSYEFTVPVGNYPGGVRFEKADYQLTAHAQTLTVLTDSTYGVPTVEMKATANTIKGVTTIAGAQNSSGIKITVDGLDSETYYAITDQYGNWVLEHIPLGYQTLRFSAINVPDVTSEVKVIANDYITVSSLEMIPDSATLKGFVFLDGMSDSSGITVTVSTYGKDDIVVRTTSDGAFTVNNILASGSHTVTFSKEGWNSQNLTINDFQPLEERAIGSSREYVLTDTTAPAWDSTPIIINNGANFANNTKLHVDLHSVEKGSGIDKMSIQITRTVDGVTSSLYPSSYNWQNYKVGFDFEIGDLPDQYVGNGTYKLYIALKDKRGNVSTTENKSITLTNLVTSLAGVLTGDKLHLTEENSPYLVEGDCLVSEGQTLVIDPGVEVRFGSGKESNGNTKLYSISISGSIEARGTQEKKILFTKAEDNTGIRSGVWNSFKQESEYLAYYWNGIAINGGSVNTENTYRYVSGNIMEYCEFEYANIPLTIKAGSYINKCYFHDCLSHVVENSTDEYYNVIFINNSFENGVELYNNSTFVNNIVSSCFYIGCMPSWKGSSFLSNNTCIDTVINFDWNSCAQIQNNNFTNCFINYYTGFDDDSPIIKSNNFTNCPTPIISTTREYVPGKYYSLTNNYWGTAQTEELNSKGNEANISFISDYYDNFNYARIDYSNWATEPFENCGYSEKGFVVFDYSVDDSFHSESKETTIPISMNIHYNQNPIAFMRFAQSREELKNASWKPYSSETSFTVDKENAVNGIITVYAQIKDTEDRISSVVSHDFIYDMPVINVNIEDNTEYDVRTSSSFSINYSATDRGGIANLELFLNDKLVNNMYWDRDGGGSQSSYTFNLITVQSGNQSLKVVAKDNAGNISEKIIHFSVSRDFNLADVENVSYSTKTGQLLKDANTVHLWHLDNDGKEALGIAEITNYTHTNGGFEGSASSFHGNVPLDISTNAFSVEFWTRGIGQVRLSKESVFVLNNEYRSAGTCYHEYKHYYKTADGVNESSFWDNYPVKKRADDQWHYWAYVYDGTYMAIYCDAVCVYYEDGYTHTLNTSNNTLEFYADGIVDELRISNCARSADEISSYYKTAKTILNSNTGSLEAIVY